ncbi:MAG TPA: DUF6544 family protein [Vicinamibacterales bacterium]|nr:DUF6544 family protein [Vicinamibacterales bacterium]
MAISATESIAAPLAPTRPLIGRKVRAIVIGLAIALTAGAILVPLQARRWTRETGAATAALTAAVPGSLPAVSLAALDGLPAPVQRYLRLALQDGQPRLASVRLEQAGRLRTGVESGQWLAFTAEETIAPEARGFVWDARLQLMPLVHASIRDIYVGGVGDGRVALLSAVTMSADHGSHDLNSGDLYRLLAEAPWSPTLLLPSEDLTWTPMDRNRTAATLTHGGETATIEFRFNDAGEVASVYAAERPRSYGTTYVATPWEGRFAGYVTVDGMRVPSSGEVGWWVEGRWQPVWQGTVQRFGFEHGRGPN